MENGVTTTRPPVAHSNIMFFNLPIWTHADNDSMSKDNA